MKHLYKLLIVPAFVLGLLLPAQTVRAQQKPLVVVSIAGLDELLGDIKFLAEQGGAPGGAALLEGVITPFTQGLDRTRPIGAAVTMVGGTPQPLVFIPVKNFGTLLGLVEQQFGQAEDAGNGVKKLSVPGAAVFIKDQNGWAFLSQSPAALAKLPANPKTLLGGLDKEYDFAVQGNLQSLPPQFKQMALQAIEQGMQLGLQQRPGESDEQYELRTTVSKLQMTQFKEIFDELDSATIGFAIDRKVKQVYLDLAVRGTSGSKLARQAAALKNTKSKFGGFLIPNAAMTFNMATKASPQDVAQMEKVMSVARQQALAEIEKDDSIPPQIKAKVKSILEDVMGVLTATFKGGQLDGGAVVILEPQAVKFAAGGLIADGKKLDKAFRDLVDLAKQEPDFPEVKFNVGKHGDVEFHSITVPVADAEAQRLLGDNVEVVVGMGATSEFVAFGKDCQSLIKQVIENSASKATETVPPLQLNVALGPIMKFAATVEDNPIVNVLSGMLAQSPGKDHVRMTAQGTEDNRGVRYRFQVEEGIIKLLGAGALGR